MPKPTKLPDLLAALDRPGIAVSRNEIISQFSEDAFNMGRRNGSIARILPRLYVHHTRIDQLSSRLVACSRWLHSDDAISGLAACHVHGLDVKDVPHIAVIRGREHRGETPAWIRSRSLNRPPPHLTIDRKRVVPLECALIDEVWERGVASAEGLIIDAIRENMTTAPRIRDALKYFPRIRHRRALIEFLTALKDGIDSYLELLADRAVFNVPDLRDLERQVTFTVDGRTYRVDAFDRSTRTAIELDSRKYHGTESARRRDIERDAALASIGIQTLRFTYEQVRYRPEWCRKIVRNTIAARRQRIAS